MEWGHTSSPKIPRKCLQTLSARKIMATVFFLGKWECASGGFPRRWFNNKLWEILWSTEKVKKSDSKQASGKTEFQGFVFSWQRPPAHGQSHSRALGSFWMGGVGSSAVQSRSCAERLPLVSKHEDLARNVALRRRRGTAGRREWLVEVSGGKILWRWN